MFSELLQILPFVIKKADMSKEMQQAAIECATKAFEKYNTETEIAAYIKDEFDRKFRPTWHCIVGRDFCSYVCHEAKHFICFYLRQLTILLFKSGARLSFAVPHAVMPPRTRGKLITEET